MIDKTQEGRIPKLGSLVIATISKVMPFGAYCRLPEYNNLEVYLPIKEVSSGWIKNIHEFIHEGQTLVCKVVFFDENRQTIDISIKKVTPTEAKQKMNEYNLEKRLVGLFQRALKVSKLSDKKESIEASVIKEFGSYTNFIREASSNSEYFNSFKLPKKLKTELLKLLEVSHKEKTYKVLYLMTISSHDTSKGVEELKNIFRGIEEQGVSIKYISAPKYSVIATGRSYLEAEKKIHNAIEFVKKQNFNGVFELEKEKLKKEKIDILNTL
ncbi:MAG: S1 RNA-binding domain-containing protein [Candidatus Micrarchaeia archaeon]